MADIIFPEPSRLVTIPEKSYDSGKTKYRDPRMAKPVVDICSEGEATVYCWNRIFRRDVAHGVWRECHWGRSGYECDFIVPEEFQTWLSKIVNNPKRYTELQRFPRLVGIPNYIETFCEIPSLRQYENASAVWTVAGLIPQFSLVLLAAPPGGYKTWFALSLAGAVSQGTEFLGRKTVRAPVLYLDRENPLSVILQRRALLNLDDSSMLKIWGKWLEDSPPLIGSPRLEEFARSQRPLIILDSFLRFHSSDENSAGEMSSVLDQLKHLTILGATVLLLHHQAKTKNSLYRGSTDILAAADAAFEISKTKSKQETILTLSCFKHRLVEEHLPTFSFVLRNGALQLTASDVSDDFSVFTDKIKETIAKIPGMTQSQIIQQVNLPEAKGRKILQQGDGKDWIVKRGNGKTLRYFLKS